MTQILLPSSARIPNEMQWSVALNARTICVAVPKLNIRKINAAQAFRLFAAITGSNAF